MLKSMSIRPGIRSLLVPLFLFVVVPMLVPASSAANGGSDYAIGADLSFLAQTEAQGTIFKDNGQAKPGLQSSAITVTTGSGCGSFTRRPSFQTIWITRFRWPRRLKS